MLCSVVTSLQHPCNPKGSDMLARPFSLWVLTLITAVFCCCSDTNCGTSLPRVASGHGHNLHWEWSVVVLNKHSDWMLPLTCVFIDLFIAVYYLHPGGILTAVFTLMIFIVVSVWRACVTNDDCVLLCKHWTEWVWASWDDWMFTFYKCPPNEPAVFVVSVTHSVKELITEQVPVWLQRWGGQGKMLGTVATISARLWAG